MKTFELFVETLKKVEVQAETIEQAQEILRNQLESQPRDYPRIWQIIVPQEVHINET